MSLIQIPAGTPASRCSGPNCGKTIYWIRTGKDRPMPIDPDCDSGAAPTVHSGGQGVAHFATCVDAGAFRKPKAAR